MFTQGIKAVIFDLDGTLFDREKAQIRVVDLFVQQFPHIFHGLDMQHIVAAFLESEQLTNDDWHAGKPVLAMRNKRSKLFLGLLGIKEDYAEAITEIYIQRYPTMNIPVAGAVAVVKELKGTFRLGVVSNGFPDAQYKKIEAIGLDSMISCVLLSEELGIRKPDPRIFLRAAQVLDVHPDECLFVGDSYSNDVVGAKSAGMHACWYNPVLPILSETDVKADLVISSFGQLAETLLNHAG